MEKVINVSWAILLVGVSSYVFITGHLPISFGAGATSTWLYGWRARVIGLFFAFAGGLGLGDHFGLFRLWI